VQAAGIRPTGAPFPQATPQTGYYGVPLLKEPQWKWEVPVYFAVGGASGASAVIAAMAEWLGSSADRKIARDARWIAAMGGIASGGLLIADLGIPSRFLNMLRVFKVQSPMSVGAWILAAFSSASSAAALADLVGERFGDALPINVLANAAQALSAAVGLVFANYTGVLIGATAIPVWNENVKTLPIHFAASGLGSAVSILELMGHGDSRALNALGIGAAAFESWEGWHIESQNNPLLRPLKHGPSGWITRGGGVLSGPLPLLLRIFAGRSASGRSRSMRRWAAYSTLAGSLLPRLGWMRAGSASARDARIPLQLE